MHQTLNNEIKVLTTKKELINVQKRLIVGVNIFDFFWL